MKEPFYSRLPEVRIWKHFLPAFSTHVFFKQPNPHRVHDAVSSVLQHGVLPPSPPPHGRCPWCLRSIPSGGEVRVEQSLPLATHRPFFFLLIFPHTE